MINSVLLGFVGPWQVVIILLVVVLLFGGRKIPELMKGIGQGMKEFKKATKEDEDEDKEKSKEENKLEKEQKLRIIGIMLQCRLDKDFYNDYLKVAGYKLQV